MSKLNGLEFEQYRKDNNLGYVEFSKILNVTYNTYKAFIKDPDKVRLSSIRKFENFYKNNIKTSEKDKVFEKSHKKDVKLETFYLESVEDIINELIVGNEIFIDNTNYSYRMSEGIIIRYSNGEPVSINAPILCSEKYFVRKPVPLSLRVGKSYINDKGEMVIIYKEIIAENVFLGMTNKLDGTSVASSFTPKGKAADGVSPDLVEEL